jgi:hypothetical protein
MDNVGATVPDSLSTLQNNSSTWGNATHQGLLCHGGISYLVRVKGHKLTEVASHQKTQ